MVWPPAKVLKDFKFKAKQKTLLNTIPDYGLAEEIERSLLISLLEKGIGCRKFLHK
jgi:hypothetical protein